MRIWQEHVIPDWAKARGEPRIRELWWRGVPPKTRAKVWELAVGNDLSITAATFEKALQRAKDIELPAHGGSNRSDQHHAWFSAIRRDVNSIFPEIRLFQPGAPLHNDLVDILMAYSMYRSDVGYSHGTHVSCLPSWFMHYSLTSCSPADCSSPRAHLSHAVSGLSLSLQSPQPASALGIPDWRHRCDG